MRIQPGQSLAHSNPRAGGTRVCPGTNQQVWLLACYAQCLVILELPGQKEVIPAAHEVCRRFYFREAMAEIDRFPVVVVGSVLEESLEMLRWPADHNLVGLAKREMSKGSLQFACAPELREDRPDANIQSCGGLSCHHCGPIKTRFQVERAALEAKMVKIGGRDLGYQGFQFGSGIGSHSPLHKAKIAAAEGSQLA